MFVFFLVPQQVSYRFFIPDTAIVNSFDLTLDGETFSAQVKEADLAREVGAIC